MPEATIFEVLSLLGISRYSGGEEAVLSPLSAVTSMKDVWLPQTDHSLPGRSAKVAFRAFSRAPSSGAQVLAGDIAKVLGDSPVAPIDASPDRVSASLAQNC